MLARKEAFPVHKYEVDAFDALSPPVLQGYLSEIAGHHADELGVGLEALMARGITWVLARLRLENPVAIALGDEVEIETWPSGIERLFALREFVVRSGGAEVARATTQWLVLDLSTRKPVRPSEVLDPRFPREPTPPVAPLARGKLAELAAWEIEKRFPVRYADIDQNLHVTNTSYLAWAIEAMPEDHWRSSRLASVEVHYLAETLHGEAILSRAKATGANAFAHAIVREHDGKELARLATTWVDR
ncbi:MAG TPA: acyl-ACP thioesterase domain-containing protein [Anaeromyxobacter sp.]